ncbi:MAG: hypothetical protein KF709_01765 [Gemmatimonadaceae bacterium]|nr:hypothetical protein [Gemmatimonadaceae bacterium]
MSHQHHYSPPRDQFIEVLRGKTMPARLKTVSLAFAALGFALFAFGAFTGEQRAWTAFLVNWLFFTTIASAGVMFVAVQRITTARWSRGIVRFMEGFVAFLPFAAVGLLIIIFGGKDHIYPWWNEVGTGRLIAEKEAYFNHGFFYLRSLVVFGALLLLQVWYVWTSVRLDVGITPEYGASWAAGLRAKMRQGFGEERRELHSTHSLQGKLAVIMAMVFGFGWCVLAWDHSMSLDYHFFSTMYGWQVFMGGWLVSLMMLAVLVRWWKGQFPELPELVTDKHYHDLGKLGFAFTAFWGYLTFSQFLIIWYGNLAEETHFFTVRLNHTWGTTTMAAAVLTFVLPFFGLLSVKAKTFSPTMIFFAACSFVGLWFSRYTEIYPSVFGAHAEHAPLGLWEVGIFAGFAGLFAWAYAQFMDAFPKAQVFKMTSPYRDEVQVPVDPKTMEPLPAHE